MRVRSILTNKGLRQVLAAAIGLSIIWAVGAPAAMPARGDAKPSIAVNAFDNEAGAAANVPTDLASALYSAVSSSDSFTVRGGGPLAYEHSLTTDPFADGLASAAKVGADYVLFGSVVQMSGGQAYYRLTLFKVAPVTFVASQVFAQGYPPADAHALVAGFAGNVATLMAPRQAVGTVYSVDDVVHADLGTAEGFSAGEQFNVMRGGQKVAEATISKISDDDATLSISNATNGYTPAVGDELLGLTPLPPALTAPPTHSTFSALGFLVAAGAVLLAIGHHGLPAAEGSGVIGSPSPSSSPFALISSFATGSVPSETLNFVFNQVFNAASTTGVVADQSYAYVVLTPPGESALPPAPLSSMGNVVVSTVTGADDAQETQVSVGTSEPGLVSGEGVAITFTSSVEDEDGQALVQTTSSGTLSDRRKTLTIGPRRGIGPVAPGPANPVPPKPLPPKNPPQ